MMTGGGIAGGLNHAIKQSPGVGRVSQSERIPLYGVGMTMVCGMPVGGPSVPRTPPVVRVL